jgi:hypothetical protein
VLRLQSASAERHIFGGEMIVAGAPARVREKPQPIWRNGCTLPRQVRKHALLALHRYKKYMRSPEPAHEPGGLFSCSERAGVPTRVCVRTPARSVSY